MSENAKPNIIPYLDAIGYEAIDNVTKFRGVITSVSFDLYGCIQFLLTPPVTKDGKMEESEWCGVNGVYVFDGRPRVVTPQPFRPVKGRHLVNRSADKPILQLLPTHRKTKTHEPI